MKSSKFGILAVVAAFVIAISSHFSFYSRIILFASGAYLLTSTIIRAFEMTKTQEAENE